MLQQKLRVEQPVGAAPPDDLMNLRQRIQLQNLGLFSDFAKGFKKATEVADAGVKAADEIYQAVDPVDYEKNGQKIMGDIATGTAAAGQFGEAIGQMEDPTNFQTGLDATKQIVDSGSMIAADSWNTIDPTDFANNGQNVMAGIDTGAQVGYDVGTQMNQALDFDTMMGIPAAAPADAQELVDYALQNLHAKTAIVTTPAKARALLNMNAQLRNPYQVKGAYLL